VDIAGFAMPLSANRINPSGVVVYSRRPNGSWKSDTGVNRIMLKWSRNNKRRITMNHQQILEQMLSFSMQQHVIKDKTIEDLQVKNAELQKQLADKPTQN
jgi:hypothetical protein